MKKLLILDSKNYTDDMRAFEKYAVRTIIVKNGRIATQHGAAGDYKIVGGGIENGETYIGQWKNNEKKGKGVLLKDKKIIYEGEFDFDNPDGIGKYYYENGNYYIGQFIEGKRHGKGILYNKNDKIIYDGEFAFYIYEGNGTVFLVYGDYYNGQFNDGK